MARTITKRYIGVGHLQNNMIPGKSIRIGVRLPTDLHAWLINQVGTCEEFSNLSQTVISILDDRRAGR